jgi:hypothetical protein
LELQTPGQRKQVRAYSGAEHPAPLGFAGIDHTCSIVGDRAMKEIPLIEELRAIRQRLAQEQNLDVLRYAAMLREVARTSPGTYVTEPFLPQAEFPPDDEVKHAG